MDVLSPDATNTILILQLGGPINFQFLRLEHGGVSLWQGLAIWQIALRSRPEETKKQFYPNPVGTDKIDVNLERPRLLGLVSSS